MTSLLTGRAPETGLNKPSTIRPLLAFALGFLASAVYFAGFTGVFHNAADEWLMFAVTESLGKRAATSVDQLYWIGEHLGWARYGLDGHLYVKYTTFSLGQSLVGVPAYLYARLLPGAGLAQGALLTNGLVVAASVALLAVTLSRLGFSRGVATVTAGAFAFGSTLWPYSQTYFGEPLLGLCFVLVFYCRLRERSSPGPSRWTWGAGLALAAGLVAKPTGLLILPFAWLLVGQAGNWQCRPKTAFALYAPSLAVGAAILATSAARFGPGEGLLHANTFSFPLGYGLYGLLLSPGRSLFVYSPVALLGLVGWPLLYRRDRRLALVLLSFVATYVVFFALWSDWFGGRTNWGPRHLMPLLPLFALAAAPAINAARRRLWLALPVALLIAVGVLVQVAAVANDYLPVMLDLIQRYPTVGTEEAMPSLRAFSHLSESPALEMLRRLFVSQSGPAWLLGGMGLDRRALVASLGLVAVAAVGLALAYRGHLGRRSWLVGGALIAAGLVVVSLVLPRYASNPGYGPAEYRAALARFDAAASPGAALVTLDNDAHRAFNYQRRAVPRYGLPRDFFGDSGPRVERLISEIVAEHDEVWVLATGDEVRSVEQRLREVLPSAEETRFGGHRLVRLRAVAFRAGGR